MNLVNLHVELQWIRPLLERLVIAVERIAGPSLSPPVLTRQSTMDDYAYIPQTEYDRVQQEQFDFAASHLITPGSEAYLQGVARYEQEIIESYGEEQGRMIIEKLPWKIQKQSSAQ